ncbi:DNA-binding MarR family transcriptional regulator [Stackebrandtia endophytica]|uniref:DNA-binding MarR family transcriptional regulator n=1 Tax=Stackebrandtia endophytica TaxID=1496996 RepID=A0A543B2C2_9ACTN|nr:MarR family winged helix-turn-helix transcriptional regulator [Stackebrandtia endophytica]TQL78985.1 DNA-binding MarR family transcriptional regulator [Stackebrandtia endophytica]
MPQSARSDAEAPAARLLEGLRSFGANYTEFTRRFADWLGLHPSDAAALAEILYAEDNGEPMNPSQLARRMALTSGATTNLVNRLENLGYVVRSREHSDRRIVTLRSGEGIEEPARRFFAPLSECVDSLVATYPPEQIEAFNRLLRQLHDEMGRLPDQPPP